MDWQQDAQQDAQQDREDAEFEAFLRRFQLRTPPAFKTGRRVTPAKLAVAAVVLLACAIPLQLLRDKPAALNSPHRGPATRMLEKRGVVSLILSNKRKRSR